MNRLLCENGRKVRYLDSFGWRLYECGYSPGVGQAYIRHISYLSKWLEQQDFKDHQLDEHKWRD